MRHEFYARVRHFSYLVPRQVHGVIDRAGDRSDGRTEAVLLKERERQLVYLGVAIVDDENDRFRGERQVVVEGVVEFGDGDGRVAVVGKPAELIAESAGRHADRRLLRVGRKVRRKVVVDQDRHVELRPDGCR